MADKKNVTRIKATDSAPKKASSTSKVTKVTTSTSKAVKAKPVSKKASSSTEPAEGKGVFARIGAYFKGAWFELRQVRWPTRRATWALTLAVLVFSLFFLLLITLLDTFFKWIFELIIA